MPVLETMLCPLCARKGDNIAIGVLKERPTRGAWECTLCRALLLVGKEQAVQHWPALAPEEGVSPAPHPGEGAPGWREGVAQACDDAKEKP